jgi:hypothetical protein
MTMRYVHPAEEQKRFAAGKLETFRLAGMVEAIENVGRPLQFPLQCNANDANERPQLVEKLWSGRPDLNRGPPAPKAGVISQGSPSFSVSVLETNELEKYLAVARCTEMWLRMHGVPRIVPIAKSQRKCSDQFPPLTKTICQHGVLQLVPVRPLPDGEDGFLNSSLERGATVANLYGLGNVGTRFNSSGILLAADSTG